MRMYKQCHIFVEKDKCRYAQGFYPGASALHLSCNTLYLLSPRISFFIVLKCELCVYHDDSLTGKRVIMQTERFVPLQKMRVMLCT